MTNLQNNFISEIYLEIKSIDINNSNSFSLSADISLLGKEEKKKPFMKLMLVCQNAFLIEKRQEIDAF